MLAGEKLECVYPEWWGAGRLQSRAPATLSAAELLAVANEDTAAIEMAATVASERREFPVAVELPGLTSSLGPCAWARGHFLRGRAGQQRR